MKDLHFRTMTLHWHYRIRSTASQRVRTNPTMYLWPISSLRIWRKVLTGVFTHCVVDETSMQITLGRTVTGTETVLMPSSSQISAEVPREMCKQQVQMTHLDNQGNEATLLSRGSRTIKVSSK